MTAAELERAREAALRALAENPDDVDALRAAGRAALEAGADDAAEHLRRAVELAPADAAAWHDLGIALVDQGRLADAAEALERAADATTGQEIDYVNQRLQEQFRLTTHPDPEYDGQVWTWVSERTVAPETHTSRSRRIETGPFEYMNIDWYFEPTDSGTHMRWVQDFSMKPTAPANDEQAQEYMNKNTREQMSVIKERIEQAAAGGSPSRRPRGRALT